MAGQFLQAGKRKRANLQIIAIQAIDQEMHVTKQINTLVDLAKKENDHITINFLQWFLTEQLEEVSSMDNLLKIIERAGTDLLQADEYLARVGSRTMSESAKE